jgi:hypothetical protein
MMLKKTREKTCVLIYINVQGFNIWKNLKVYMHPRLGMHEHFEIITNSLKYECETCD